MSEIRIVFAGSEGRMGRALLPGLHAAEGVAVVGEADVGDDLAQMIADTRAEVVVDFTTPAAAMPNARTVLAAGAHGVIGTTGFSAADLDALEAEAEAAGCGLLIAPNFSLGMILLQRFSEEAARHFPRVEIIETHHEGKLDAPSGTALRTAERLAAAGAESGPASNDIARGEDVSGVRVHSRRLPGIQAQQDVLFASESETLTLSHHALSRSCYLAGVLAAVRGIRGRRGLLRGLEPILFGDDETR
ncbi:MAG: 4-hydroxy-tetrahydrodipicolinate reductase [Planctomycetota bacterium]|nr:4-hydroxy-tetrahydrodipicolinate reductase [Planctomycetota bacterium]